MRLLPLLAALLCCDAAIAASSFIAPGAPSYPQLVREWWQWSLSSGNAPARDLDGSQCHAGQSGATWFLAGTIFGEAARRTCRVPAGKAIFFPVVTVTFYPDIPGGASCDGSRSRIEPHNGRVAGLRAELDGEKLAITPATAGGCFELFARKPAAERKRVTYPAAAMGHWVLLRPLPRGRHTLAFGGRYTTPAELFGDVRQDVVYTLIVE